MTAADLSIGSRLDWINHFINLSNIIDKNLRDSCGLNITQARILFYIGTHEAQPIGDVGAALSLKPSTITAATNHLVDDGYATRSFNTLDRRNVNIGITEKGVEVAPSFIPAVHKAFTEDLPIIDKDLKAELTQLLLPPSSPIFSGTDEEDVVSIATRIAADLKLDNTRDEIIEHITRVLIIDNICRCLSQMSEFDRSFDLSPNEARILRALGNGNNGMRLKDLSSFLNIRPNVASISIRTLEDDGLIDRTINAKDRRAANIALTRKGTNLLRITRVEYCEVFDECFPGLANREVSEFFPLLEL